MKNWHMAIIVVIAVWLAVLTVVVVQIESIVGQNLYRLAGGQVRYSEKTHLLSYYVSYYDKPSGWKKIGLSELDKYNDCAELEKRVMCLESGGHKFKFNRVVDRRKEAARHNSIYVGELVYGYEFQCKTCDKTKVKNKLTCDERLALDKLGL
jgi:hypothetical protein